MGESSMALAMIVLSEPVLPDLSALERALQRQWPEKPRFKRVEPRGEIISFQVGDAIGFISLMPALLPEAELDRAQEFSATWVGSRETLRAQRAHLLCTMSGSIEKKQAAFYLTRFIATISGLVPCLGIYWGAAGLIHSREIFVQMAEGMTEDLLPLYLWIRFAGSQKDGRIDLRTRGMAALGFMEMEIVGAEHAADEVVNIAFNACHYLLDYGLVLKDGDTFGLSEDQKILVQHAPSAFGEPGVVYRLGT